MIYTQKINELKKIKLHFCSSVRAGEFLNFSSGSHRLFCCLISANFTGQPQFPCLYSLVQTSGSGCRTHPQFIYRRAESDVARLIESAGQCLCTDCLSSLVPNVLGKTEYVRARTVQSSQYHCTHHKDLAFLGSRKTNDVTEVTFVNLDAFDIGNLSGGDSATSNCSRCFNHNLFPILPEEIQGMGGEIDDFSHQILLGSCG